MHLIPELKKIDSGWNEGGDHRTTTLMASATMEDSLVHTFRVTV